MSLPPPDIARAQMTVLRTIFALLIAASVATLPAAGATAFKLQPQEAPEMSASEPMHDCCPPAADPCDKADCASMATCALPCCSYLGAGASPLVYPTMHADLIPLLPSDVLPSHMGSPPFRPPRA